MKTTTSKPVAELSLNELTIEITAFGSWFDFSESMTNNGYIPTLAPHGGRSKAQKYRNEMCAELCDRIRKLGYLAYDGTETR